MNRKEKKIAMLVGILILAVGLGAGKYFVSGGQGLDHTKQYTEEEWRSFSKKEQDEIRNFRLCKHAEPGHTEGVHDVVVPLGVDCKKYK